MYSVFLSSSSALFAGKCHPLSHHRYKVVATQVCEVLSGSQGRMLMSSFVLSLTFAHSSMNPGEASIHSFFCKQFLTWHLAHNEYSVDMNNVCIYEWMFTYVYTCYRLPRLQSDKESACQCRRCKKCRFNPWVCKIFWRRKFQTIPVFLSGKFQGQRSLCGVKSQTRLSDWAPPPLHVL